MDTGHFKRMTEEQIRYYIPDVYQHDIYAIDYSKLKEAGIKLISFDIDDTIDAFLKIRAPGYRPPKRAIALFQRLKADGFTVALLTNAFESVGACFYEKLGADYYITRAKKPRTDNFEKMMEEYGLSKYQMAHVGNSMMNDVAGGNIFGITTCLVRAVGKAQAPGKALGKALGMPTESQQAKHELKDRGLWRHHHKYEEDDQYYQLGEMPRYLMAK